MPNKSLQIFLLSVIFLIGTNGLCTAKSKQSNIIVKEKKTAEIQKGYTIISKSIKYSADWKHVAYAAYNKDKQQIVQVDDTTSPVYHSIRVGTPIFSPKGDHCGYIAYKGENGAKAVVVVDGKVGPEFDDADQLQFSPDGSRYMYRAQKGNKQCVVVDGKPGPLFDGIPVKKSMLFSPNSKHYAYVAFDGKKCMLVLDGHELKLSFAFIEDVAFSPDSEHFAYKGLVEENGEKKWCVVRDEKKGPVLTRVFDTIFSYDSKHLAYSALKDRQMVLMVDGNEICRHDGIGVPIFSYNSKTLAYAFVDDKEWHIVVNGKKSSAFDSVGKFFFSLDSKRYAFFGKDGDKWYCVVDGNKGPGFEKEVNAFSFSLNSERYVYAGVTKDGAQIITDGNPSRIYPSVGEPYFSPDSKHVVFRARLKKGAKWFTLLDGKVSKHSYQAIAKYQFSPDSNHLAVNAMVNLNKTVMLVDGTEECAKYKFKILGDPYFSPDSKHIAYFARAGDNNWHLVIDGEVLPEVFGGFMDGTPITFDSPNHFHIIGVLPKGTGFMVVNVTIPASLPGLKTKL